MSAAKQLGTPPMDTLCACGHTLANHADLYRDGDSPCLKCDCPDWLALTEAIEALSLAALTPMPKDQA